MPRHKYRHKCVRCKKSRSESFHRLFPAGPGYPDVKGVCRRCIGPGKELKVHIHHHHWYIPEETQDCRTPFSGETLTTSSKEEELPRGSSQRNLSRHSELPATPPPYHPYDLPPGRAELADGPGPRPQELAAGRDVARSPPPPPVGPKPRYHAYHPQLHRQIR